MNNCYNMVDLKIKYKGVFVMINDTNFIVRLSGEKDNGYYIDYLGVYKVVEISKLVNIGSSSIRDTYMNHGAIYNEMQDIYYFTSIDHAKATIVAILQNMKTEQKGRLILLSEAEIEYIRKALINEGGNTLHVKNSIKDHIFKKLNR